MGRRTIILDGELHSFLESLPKMGAACDSESEACRTP